MTSTSSSRSDDCEQTFPPQGLTIDDWARSRLPDEYELARTKPGRVLTGAIGFLGRNQPVEDSKQRILEELKQKFRNGSIRLVALNSNPTKAPIAVDPSQLDRVIDNVELGHEDGRPTGIRPLRRHPSDVADEEQWFDEWISMNLRIFPGQRHALRSPYDQTDVLEEVSETIESPPSDAEIIRVYGDAYTAIWDYLRDQKARDPRLNNKPNKAQIAREIAELVQFRPYKLGTLTAYVGKILNDPDF